MKRNHSPGGKGIALRIFVYTLAFSAVLGVREVITDGTGPVSRNLGAALNELLMISSKLGLGIAQMNADAPGDITMIGKGSRMLGEASHKGFVTAAKVEIFAP